VIASLPCVEATPPAGVRLCTQQGEELPAQVCEVTPDWCRAGGQGQVQVAFVVPQLAAGETLHVRGEFGDFPDPAPQVLVAPAAAGQLEVRVQGELLTTYRYLGDLVRPCCYPVLAPGGVGVTRRWPLEDTNPNEPHDHPHHRSMWVAHGAINGTDNWSEGPNHGYQLHREVLGTCSGTVLGQFSALNDWTDREQRRVLQEVRTLTAYAVAPEVRLFDFDVTFHATDYDVRFGDTKEGGILAFRVATGMDGDHGGRIENAYGGVGEAECWGKRAPWCDYSGRLAGETLGVAIFDHPRSFRHPTYWHVRDYGMYTANPFGWHDFHHDPARDGSHLLPKGATLTFHYRVYLHRGDTQEAEVGARYHDYAHPPRVETAAERG
jgi:hypothetical protein